MPTRTKFTDHGNARQFVFDYDDLHRCTKRSYEMLFQDVSRAKIDPERLESLACYLARYATDGLRQKIVEAALSRPNEKAIGELKPKSKPAKRKK